MAYTFYLDGVQLPVTPAKLETKVSSKNQVITLINEGDVNVLKSPSLTEISFDALIPQVNYPFVEGFTTASYYLNKLEKLKTSQKPFRFIVSRVSPSGKMFFSSNIEVALEDYTIREDAKDGFDLLIPIKLKQYKNYGTKTIKVVNYETGVVSVQQERPVGIVPTEPTHTVVSGDSLWNIAKRCLGDGAKYIELYQANKDIITNPINLTVGQVLRLPRK